MWSLHFFHCWEHLEDQFWGFLFEFLHVFFFFYDLWHYICAFLHKRRRVLVVNLLFNGDLDIRNESRAKRINPRSRSGFWSVGRFDLHRTADPGPGSVSVCVRCVMNGGRKLKHPESDLSFGSVLKIYVTAGWESDVRQETVRQNRKSQEEELLHPPSTPPPLYIIYVYILYMYKHV